MNNLYMGETDYRKIPRNKLNPRIPKGRGKIKWMQMDANGFCK